MPAAARKRAPADDATPSFIARPHSMLALFLVLLVLVYVAFTTPPDSDTPSNMRRGVVGAAVIFLLMSALYLSDGPFQRPHPVVWRIALGSATLYLMLLMLMLFQNVDDVRQALHDHIDPSLGVPLAERSYGEACDLYTPDDDESLFRNLRDTINDEFFVAHILGWYFKMLIIRDVYISLSLSVLFEVWEYTFAFQLNNFHECWWDHFVLDILLCNNLGIVLGMVTLHYLSKVKTYNWTGLYKLHRRTGSLMDKFVPRNWDDLNWAMLSSPRRFLQVLFVMLLLSCVELNAFYLKYLLWIPPPHPINICRLFFFLFLGAPAMRDFYLFFSDKHAYKMGSHAWLSVAVCGAEVLVIIKFGLHELRWWPPAVVWVSWVVFLVFFWGAFLWYFYWYLPAIGIAQRAATEPTPRAVGAARGSKRSPRTTRRVKAE